MSDQVYSQLSLTLLVEFYSIERSEKNKIQIIKKNDRINKIDG